MASSSSVLLLHLHQLRPSSLNIVTLSIRQHTQSPLNGAGEVGLSCIQREAWARSIHKWASAPILCTVLLHTQTRTPTMLTTNSIYHIPSI